MLKINDWVKFNFDNMTYEGRIVDIKSFDGVTHYRVTDGPFELRDCRWSVWLEDGQINPV